MHYEPYPLLDLDDLFRQRLLAQLCSSAGPVDQVDGLVGQIAGGKVSLGEFDSVLERVVGVGDVVKLLITVLDAGQDLDGVRRAGRRHVHDVKAALEPGLFLDTPAIICGRGRSDALDFSVPKHRLQDVGRVKRAFGAPRVKELFDNEN